MYNPLYWRRTPYITRKRFSKLEISDFDNNLFYKWVSHLPHMRVFVNEASSKKPTNHSRLISNEHSSDIYERLRSSSEKYTILLNDIETVYEEILKLRTKLDVPFEWRVDDVVATYSSKGSGIGYHAGHEDAIIFQASGSRKWKVWGPAEINQDLRKRILISAPDDIYAFNKPDKKPIFECTLNEGDTLYIPPFFPHEGITEQESISIAFGWKGICHYHLSEAFNQNINYKLRESLTIPDKLFELIDDFSPLKKAESIDELAVNSAEIITENSKDRDEIKLKISNLMAWRDNRVPKNNALPI